LIAKKREREREEKERKREKEERREREREYFKGVISTFKNLFADLKNCYSKL